MTIMESKFLKSIVKEAEKISKGYFEVYQKDDEGDLVTSLDLEIEKFLIKCIKQNYPNYSIVSEEYNSDEEIADDCFIIDPIDGTANFTNNLPLWGIQIACRKNGETVASVIDLPEFGELYYANRTGAYLNGKKIHTKVVPIKNALYAIEGYDEASAIKKMQYYSRKYRVFGTSSVELAFLACGRIHGFNHRKETPWDYEPGLFLCKMAGAKIKNVRGFHAAAMNQKFLDILEKETAL